MVERLPELVECGGVRARTEFRFRNLSRTSLGIPVEHTEVSSVVQQFVEVVACTMRIHRHSVFKIKHAKFIQVDAFELSLRPQLELDSLRSMLVQLAGPPLAASKSSYLSTLGIVASTRLLASLARIRQSLFCYRDEDKLAINAEVALDTFAKSFGGWLAGGEAELEARAGEAAARAAHDAASSQPAHSLSYLQVLNKFVNSLNGELAGFFLSLLGQNSAGRTTAGERRSKLLESLADEKSTAAKAFVEVICPGEPPCLEGFRVSRQRRRSLPLSSLSALPSFASQGVWMI